MKILFVQKIAGISGSEKYLFEIMPELISRGHDCHFLGIAEKKSEKKNTKILEEFRNKNITVHYLIYRNWFVWTLLKKIHAILRKENYDIVQSNLIHADFWMSLVKRFWHKNMVLVSGKHGFDNEYVAKYGFSTKKIFSSYILIQKIADSKINRSFFIGRRLMELFVELNITKKERAEVIYYGFRFPAYRLTVSGAKFRFASRQILIVGRLVKYKGHALGLNILKDILLQMPDTKLVIVGDGPERNSIESKIRELGLENYVILTGHSTEVMEYMLNSDLLIIPSVAEGFGIIALEAFSNKLPVLAFNVPTLNEIIKNRKTGYLTAFGDPKTFKDTVMEILNIEAERKHKITDAAYEELTRKFSIERMVNETMKFYEHARNKKYRLR